MKPSGERTATIRTAPVVGPPISVCIVAMDEERNIAECLESADFAREWIVIDSHSSDATRERAAAFGARVIERDWAGYVGQKNFAVEQASSDWVLCLDADERVSPELRASILAAFQRSDLPDGFEMSRLTRYLGRWIRHGGWYPDRKLRLFRRSRGRWEGVDPHDRVRLNGRTERLRGDLVHYPYRSISDHMATIESFTTIAARERHASGRRAGVFDIALRPMGKFLRMYVAKLGFLDGRAGLIIAGMGAFYVLLKYAKLWELGRAGDDSRVTG